MREYERVKFSEQLMHLVGPWNLVAKMKFFSALANA